jgi:lipopolysaccharide/colanic/teichoic acid biosynthesis glycosyltransferase
MTVLPRVINREQASIVQVPIENYANVWIPKELNFDRHKPIQALFKRTLDLLLSVPGLIILAPFLLIVIIAIKLESKGPAIFKQKRMGLNARPFYMYKFRTMVENADKQEDHLRKQFDSINQIMFKMEEDPRVTKLGRILRKYSIDEFPQLWNVIKGEMSLVGPRPTLPKVVKLFEKWHYTYFAAKPGITGMWQTNGRSSIKDFNKIASLETIYIKHWNLLMDLHILLKTIPVVLSGKDAA